MRYVYLTTFLIALMMPAAAITQMNTAGNFSIVFSTYPERLIVNVPTHIELHIQNIENAATVGKLEVEKLLVHLHEANEPNIPHKYLLDMKENPNEPPGHYHTNYTFNESGAYGAVVQFKSNGEDIESIFSIDVKPKEREPLKTMYGIFGIIAATLIVAAAVAWAFRKAAGIFKIK